MTHKGLANLVSAAAVALLLVTTATGNAWAMLVCSGLALIAGRLAYGRRVLRDGVLAASVGAAVAIVIAVVMLLLR